MAADRGLFGRQYMSVDRVASALPHPLGSGQASVAHEMFHAVFRSYNIPALVFCNTAGDECRRSSSGINEGMATSAGYWIDQGSPAKPRPNQAPRPLYWPFAWFDADDADTMYMNQDFYVYLLRVGTLANFRMHLDALASAVVPARGTLFDVLSVEDVQDAWVSRWTSCFRRAESGLGHAPLASKMPSAANGSRVRSAFAFESGTACRYLSQPRGAARHTRGAASQRRKEGRP